MLFSGFSGGMIDGLDMNQISQIQKAYEAGSTTGIQTLGQLGTQAPIKIENLDPLIKVLTVNKADFKFWNMLPKQSVSSNIHQYTQFVDIGDGGGFTRENELTDFNTPANTRRIVEIKAIQVPTEVTIMSTLVQALEPAQTQSMQAAMLRAALICARSLVHADSRVVPESFDGLNKLHAIIGNNQNDLYANFDQYVQSGRCVDLRGGHLTQEIVQEAMNTINKSFGTADTLVSTNEVIIDFSTQLGDKMRFIQMGGGFGTTVGAEILRLRTVFGEVDLVPDKFVAKTSRRTTDAKTGASAPNAPVADATTPAAVTGAADAFSKWGSDEAGKNYLYAVASVNRFGESVLTPLGAGALTAVSGRSVDLKFTASNSGTAATGFVIYRSEAVTAGTPFAAANFWPVFKVSATDLSNGYDGAAAGLVRDRNRFLPATQEALLFEMNSEIVSLAELLPISLYDLAMLTSSFRKMILYYVAPKVASPTKMVRFINVGRYVAP